jgi:hypothetical protein
LTLPRAGPLRRSALIVSLPAILALVVGALGFLATARHGPSLPWSFIGPAAGLLVWNAGLAAHAARERRALAVTVVLRKQHYLQACAQGSVLLYWGWYWRPVYEAVPLIAAQLAFAYAFDMLLAWSRRETYALGFGPVPVVFSINLFLWFKPDWFFLQFAMIAVGFAAKAFLRWNRDGRRVHIFNPSSFPLAVFSVALILAGASGVTRGQDIAISQFYPPHMYLALFLVALPGQYFFGVASMTLAAVATTYVLGLLYYAATGTYFFYDSYIPIAVFLGMHLLFTDPSTAPRTELGRLVFGALYGASSMALYWLLGAFGVPAFYDKLLQVPLLNLMVRWLDRVSRSGLIRAVDPVRLGRSLAPRQRHVAYLTLWAGVFAVMSATGGVGDRHPGQWPLFWERACGEGRLRACRYLADLERILCEAGSGWACNETGLRVRVSPGASEAAVWFERGCRLGFTTACGNALGSAVRAQPALADYPILLRGSKGPIADRTPANLYAMACAQGWPDACDRRAAGQ